MSHSLPPTVGAGELAAAQRALVAALVTGAADPAGFDRHRLAAARRALLHKRAGELARHWPGLVRALADRWPAVFVSWARARTPVGGWRDGWDLARELAETGQLPATARAELAVAEVRWRYDGRSGPRLRRWPALRRTPDGVVVQVARRVRLLRRRRAAR
ncbi:MULTISPECIES: hypothetical protein [unclassified Solwaraspora]|uniref:hypothetical protein n=1 Tax=unclassified Solwaraspora TaxID=2627926 RepID=UPI00259B2C6E|nr:hypothetical protein [Solwaraspora sp. WMMA2056]WJK38351.1 hypothetical protein O7608_17745 [Solwaraspora sp. WMMA2056]